MVCPVLHVGLGVGDGLGVLLCGEGDCLGVVEGGVDLGGDVASVLRGGPPGVGV